ncbi:hypothetical protein NC651_008169 [Populus alba x Populus x berolinensis]|nr:hypothetical protein NC651_008169 [Populus alba x Populus x berolinensis]
MQCTSGESSGNRENSMPSVSLLGLEEEFRNGRIAGSKSDFVRSSAPEDSNLLIIVYASRTHSQLRQVIQEEQLQMSG